MTRHRLTTNQNVSSNQYTCAMCSGTFEKGWSDEEAKTELAKTFGNFALVDCAVVCDDCYQKFMDESP